MSILKHSEEENNLSSVPSVTSSYTNTPAVEARVTPQEFARALASLEARKEQSERALQETVPLGDVIQQLGVTAGAEEILAEVQALRNRAAQAQAQQAGLQRKRGMRTRLQVAFAVGGVLLGLLVLGASRMTVTEAAPATPMAPAAVEVPAPVAELQTLAEVPEGRQVQVKTEDLKAVLQNPSRSLSKIIVQTLGAASSVNRWTLIKHDGHIYLRGYLAAMSPQVMTQMKTIQIFAAGFDNTVGGGMAYVKPVNLRIGSFSWHGQSEEAGIPYITASDLHPDEYANEHTQY